MPNTDAVVLGTYCIIVEMTTSRNMELLVSYSLEPLIDDLSLSLSLSFPQATLQKCSLQLAENAAMQFNSYLASSCSLGGVIQKPMSAPFCKRQKS